LEQYLSVSEDRSLKGGDYIKSPYDSGCRYEVVAGSQVGHGSAGNGLCGNRLVMYLTPRRSLCVERGGRV